MSNENINEEKSLLAEFHKRAIINQDKSNEAGRQIYEDKLYVKVHIKGSKNAIQDKLATEEDKARFPRAWALYKARGEEVSVGTPLDKLPCMSQALEMNLKALGVMNVEDLAEIDLNGATNIKGGNGLKAQAQAYLKLANEPVKHVEVTLDDDDPIDLEDLESDPGVVKKETLSLPKNNGAAA